MVYKCSTDTSQLSYFKFTYYVNVNVIYSLLTDKLIRTIYIVWNTEMDGWTNVHHLDTITYRYVYSDDKCAALILSENYAHDEIQVYGCQALRQS